MSAIEPNSSSSSLARGLYHLHGYLSGPNYGTLQYFIHYRNPWTPGCFDNCQTRIQEIIYRAMAPLLLIASTTSLYAMKDFYQVDKITYGFLALLFVWEAAIFLIHLAAYITQRGSYIHVRGSEKAKEISQGEIKIASWNIAGFPSGITYVDPIWKRFDRIVEEIKKTNADIVVLQECLIDGRLPEAFIQQFKDQYAHFFIHNGPHIFGPESGLLVMSKCAVYDYNFEFFKDISTSQFNINRGFVTLQVKAFPSDSKPAFAVIGTHMDCRMDVDDKGYQKDENSIGSANRKKQLLQIQEKADQLKETPFVIFAGDSNINMKDEKAKKTTAIEAVLINPFQVTGKDGQIDRKNGTCTDAFEIMWKKESKKADEWHLDQIALVKRTSPDCSENKPSFKVEQVLRDRKIVPIYQDETTCNDALSDHQIIVATVQMKA